MSCWSIFQNFSIPNIFTKAKPKSTSNIDLKKDDDYEFKHHLAVMEEINRYKKYDLQSLSDSDIQAIAEYIYSLAKESGEIYFKSDMFYKELREIKKVLLLQDIRIIEALFNLIVEAREQLIFKGIWELDHVVRLSRKQGMLWKKIFLVCITLICFYI
ncbi:unnamed protein product [Blepharisma stoltei]|uniref:Uncharacterized protein n=1 Tax=Blepharisma stoltei TaxID=1481888 RepID=A0AAU9J1Z5_9CILI|nr:unnamed protein product [Blepharisma stoltei]